MRHVVRILLAVLASSTLAACGDDPAGPKPRITLAADAEAVTVGEIARLRATGIDAARLAGTEWQVLDAGIVSPRSTSDSVLTLAALDPGTARVVVRTAGGLADTLTVVVLAPRFSGIIAAGGNHACALTLGGDAYCWGTDVPGGASGMTPERLGRPRNDFTDRLYVGLSATAGHTCALDQAGESWCWGTNSKSQVGGNANVDYTALPYRHAAPAGKYVDVAAGSIHSCAVTSGGETWCWGSGTHGAVGSTNTYEPTPIRAALGVALVKLAAGPRTQCGLDADGRAWCWGANPELQLGRGTPGTAYGRGDDTVARPVASANRYTALAAASHMTCGVTTSQAVDCWGEGPLGDGQVTTADSLPHRVIFPDGVRIVAITAGVEHACAMDDAGVVRCWGKNTWGQLGDGSMTDRAIPSRVSGTLAFDTIDAGADFTCGAARDGRVYCWGMNGYGQLGTGDTMERTVPTRVGYQP